MGDNIGILVATDISGSAAPAPAPAVQDEDGSNISKSLKHYATVRRMLRTFAIDDPDKEHVPSRHGVTISFMS